MHYVTITTEDNDMSNHTGVVYTDNDAKLSWPIGSRVNYDENQIGQLRD